jgi:phosphoribosylamine---glycine ligase
MKVLVVGGGGREHAIVRALQRSPQQPELLCAPGNPGIAADGVRCFPDVGAEDLTKLIELVRDEAVDLTVVGPEAPLVLGLVDDLHVHDLTAFGPRKEAARLEGSKAFAKQAMVEAGVPTGGFEEVDTVEAGLAATGGRYPTVVKFDGLAAGKGVVIAQSEDEARAALVEMLEERRFGPGKVVVEEHLEGEELSLFALCDGERAIPLAPAQDFKRIGDGDTGPNTGGMGAFSPVPGAPDPDELCALVHQPIVDLMKARDTPFHGVLYAGLMLTAEGPKVLEYNTRFGDPETQVVLARLESDLLDLLLRCTRPGGLEGARAQFSDRTAVTVVLASAGYPASARKGDVIEGLDEAGDAVLHAGTATDDAGRVVTGGGRVLAVTALGDGPAGAREAAYAAADRIRFDGLQRREDIALRAAERTP